MLKRVLDSMFARPLWQFYRETAKTDPLFIVYPLSIRHRVMTVGVNKHRWSRWKNCLLIVTHDGITLYPYQAEVVPKIICAPSELRWFGRPHKYKNGDNDILIHMEIQGQWQVISLRMSRGTMQKLIRALKVIATDEQVTAYRRWRPYIHYGPVDFHPATQDIYGAWDVSPEAFTLYLTPMHLIILDGEQVLRVIDLQTVQKIQSLKRLDAPDKQGVVRFEVEAEKLAFVLDKHDILATQIAEAAKRSLEDPIQQKRKKKDDYDDDDD